MVRLSKAQSVDSMNLERLIFITLVSAACLIVVVLTVVVLMSPELMPWHRPS